MDFVDNSVFFFLEPIFGIPFQSSPDFAGILVQFQDYNLMLTFL